MIIYRTFRHIRSLFFHILPVGCQKKVAGSQNTTFHMYWLFKTVRRSYLWGSYTPENTGAHLQLQYVHRVINYNYNKSSHSVKCQCLGLIIHVLLCQPHDVPLLITQLIRPD
jgi:hypothetical protein